MNGLSAIMRAITGVNRLIGVTFAWLALAIVVICFWVVVERYAFGNTRLWMQDLYPWLNGVLFTAVAAYALYHDDHVRVDIFYRPASAVTKGWMDLVGVLVFLFGVAEAFMAKRKVGNNPWGEGATTLEWTLPSPPPFHQYEDLPVVRERQQG